MVSEKSLTLTLDARLTYNIIARLTQASLVNEIRQRSTIRSTRECSQATPGNRNIGYDTPRANHLPRCLLSAILSRHTVTKYVHEVRLRVIQQDDRKSISQQRQMQDRQVQPSQLNV